MFDKDTMIFSWVLGYLRGIDLIYQNERPTLQKALKSSKDFL